MSLSIIIPVFNEEDQIKITLNKLLKIKKIIKDFEIILINDFSTDKTENIIKNYIINKKYINLYKNNKKGLGSAIQNGILRSKKKYVCLFMADMSDDVKDLIKYYKLIRKKNIDAVFGTRFSNKSIVKDYPSTKYILNRIFNNIVKYLFLSNYNDFTNSFKIYKKKTLKKLLPIVSENFNVFLELPLKVLIRKYTFLIIPINWSNRKKGSSSFRIKELGSKYLFTLFYCLWEKILLNSKK